MATTITVTDNFQSDFATRASEDKPYYHYQGDKEFFKASAKNNLETLIDGRVWSSLENCHFFSPKGEQSTIDDNELILSIQRSVNSEADQSWRVQAGNFVGNIQYQGRSIELKSRFSDAFLQRMLTVINNVHLSEFEGQEANRTNYAEFILHYLFVQKLEKVFLLGFPKNYAKQKHHEASLKGKLDISSLIKKDIPYKGKVSSVSRHRTVDAAVLSVLNRALKIVFKRSKSIAQNVRHVHNAILQLNPNDFRRKTLSQAKTSKALSNPLFAPFKEVVNLAGLIIEQQSLKQSKNNDKSSFGFLVDVAELFELYVKALLQNNFSDWYVHTPELQIYKNNFFSRKIIPDIVMERDGKVIVFDTKYKRMLFRGTKEQIWDVDRSDFFQIHTYMSYYDTHPNFSLVGGGLLYPISKEFDIASCHSNSILDNDGNAWFIVDGIDLSNLSIKKDDAAENDFEKIAVAEDAFVTRIKRILL